MAALSGLFDSHLDLDVTVFDIGKAAAPTALSTLATLDDPRLFYDSVYRRLRRQPRTFPPPKTHHGQALQRFNGPPALYRSETYGGLSNFWGGTLLPFSARELVAWPPLSRALDVAYSRIADIVGIAGADDHLSRYFDPNLVNRPPIPMLAPLAKLCSSTSEHERVWFGANRCAVETRPGQARRCVGCGECLAGCFRDSIYATPQTLDDLRRDPRMRAWIRGRVRRITPDAKELEFEDGERLEKQRFDVILLGAGCLGTTEIVLRSLNLTQPVEVCDNAVIVFPIVAPAAWSPRQLAPHLGLANVLGVVVPPTSSAPTAQLQIYPTSAYMLRYNFDRLWPWLQPLHPRLLRRLFWVRMFLHSDDSQTYRMSVTARGVTLTHGRVAPLGAHVEAQLAQTRRALTAAGFWVPPVPRVVQSTNSHYGATLPFGGPMVAVGNDAQVLPGVYLCDSSCFPEMPAVHPTMTIMAHAYRTARWAVGLPF